mgnify:CR=1 FL=1
MRIFFALLFLSGGLAAQSPGGVPGALLWGKPRMQAGPYSWGTDADKACSFDVGTTLWVNHWPLPADAAQLVGFSWPLAGDAITLFSVYLPASTNTEEVIYALETGNQTTVVLTNRRLARLDPVAYLNLPRDFWRKPRLNTWQQRLPAGEDVRLKLGQVSRADLPVAKAAGHVAEVIAFPRYLRQQERRQVDTYLALKYGLALVQPADYVGAAGERLWSAQQDSAYAHRITGLGRSDAAGWYQPQSSFATLQPTLSIALDRWLPPGTPRDTLLPNDTYLLWGDNNAPWDFQADAGPTASGVSQRHWKIRRTGGPIEVATEVRINPDPWWPEADSVFLDIDRSGDGTFLAENTDVYAALEQPNKGQWTFFGVTWDPDRSGEDICRLRLSGDWPQQAQGWSFDVFPNPFSAGSAIQVAWRSDTPPDAPLSITLFDAGGRQVAQKTYVGTAEVQEAWRVAQPGLYWIVARSGSWIKTRKVLAQ